MSKPRARDLGLDFGGRPGANNAITDVPGVHVGYTTLIHGHGELRRGHGPVRTGVTAILPRPPDTPLTPVWAGFHALNGNGEMTGTHWIRHGGHFSGPVCLTNTHSVGIVHDAATAWMIDNWRDAFEQEHIWAMPVVAETYDGVLNDINGRHITREHALAAIESARTGPIAEGNVGGGTGMIAYEFKGGTGTSSRMLSLGSGRHHVGALVQANHGLRDWFTVLGVPIGREWQQGRLLEREQGSIIVVIGCDVPALPHQLERLAQRASIGIGRHGTPGGNNSGDIFLAFTTANPVPRADAVNGLLELRALPDEWFDEVYLAAVQCVDEAVINAMLAAESMTTLKPAGKRCEAIDKDRLVEMLRARGAIQRGLDGPEPSAG